MTDQELAAIAVAVKETLDERLVPFEERLSVIETASKEKTDKDTADGEAVEAVEAIKEELKVLRDGIESIVGAKKSLPVEDGDKSPESAARDAWGRAKRKGKE